MAASNDHLKNILGGAGPDDTPANAQETQRALEAPQPDDAPAHNPGLDNGPRYQEPEQPQPAQQPAAPQQPAPDQEVIPPSRLREETQKRRDAEDKAQRVSDRLEILQEQIQERQRLETQRLQQQNQPTIDDDLPGYVQSQAQRLEEALNKQSKEFKEFKEQTTREREEASVISEIRQRANSDSQAFAQKNPDFAQAYHWMRNQQVAEIQALTGATAEQAIAHVDSQELQFTAHRIQQGMNAAEGFYAQAKARGWGANPQAQPQQLAAPAQQAHLPPPQQAAPQQQVIPAPQHNPTVYAQPLQQIDQGRQQNMTLDMVPQGGTAVPMDLEKFSEMSEADFLKYSDQVVDLMARTMR